MRVDLHLLLKSKFIQCVATFLRLRKSSAGWYILNIVFFWVQSQMAVCQNLVPLVNIKIAGKWMFIPLKMVLIGIGPYPNAWCRRRLTRNKVISAVALHLPACRTAKHQLPWASLQIRTGA